MAKIKTSILSPSDKMYAILAPGIGYMKFDLGYYTMHDKLPRRSGSFATKEEAEAVRAKACAWIKKNARSHFYISREEAMKAANTAVVVKITVTKA